MSDYGLQDDSNDATSLPRPHTEWIFSLPEMWKLRENQCSQDACIFLGRKETDYLSVIVDNGTLRLSPDKFVDVRNWLLPKTQIHIKPFVHFFLW